MPVPQHIERGIKTKDDVIQMYDNHQLGLILNNEVNLYSSATV